MSNWHDVIKVIGDTLGLYALCKDGTILTTDKEKKDEISRWKLFDNYENIDTERKESIERAGIERKNKIDIINYFNLFLKGKVWEYVSGDYV